MKRIVPILLLTAVCVSVSLADYDDGFITAGEYEYFVQLFNQDVLIVEGGGADIIEARDFSYVEVRYTSTPLGLDVGGIWDILLVNDSDLLYLDGLTDIMTIGSNAEAVLKGGSINYIRGLQYTDTKHIDLYCQPGWSWLLDDTMEKIGITGLWENSTPFSIEFINDQDYDPVWMNINVVPEPTSLVLLALGGLLIRRNK